jgi:hypothetical protein
MRSSLSPKTGGRGLNHESMLGSKQVRSRT